MSTNRNAGQEIRLKDLGLHFLKRWKSLLLAALLLAAALGGWQAVKVAAAHRDGGQTKDEARYAHDLALYQELTANAEQNVRDRRAQLNARTGYREHSILMNLDPENVWTAEKKYLVSAAGENAEGSGSLLDAAAAYTGAMDGEHEEAALLEAFGTDNAGYARETVSIAMVPGENSFTVRVFAADAEKAAKGLEYVSKRIEAAEHAAQEICGHTLRVLNEGVSRQILPELAETQSRLTGAIEEYEAAVRESERLLQNRRESIPSEPGNPVVRWAVAGGVLGLLAMAAVYLTTFLRKKNEAGE